MQLRRTFVEGMTGGLLGAMAQPGRALGANDRIRLGIIGSGAQGQALVRAATSCPDTEIVAAADVYTRRLEEVTALAPGAKTYLDYRHVLDDKSIDAVLIATPQHLHCQHFVASLDAGKHVYQEKTMAFTVAHAKRMRAAYQRAGRRTVQIGNQGCSQG
ncbi:MAG: Gfo/Idh/MocA family oxidoreductase [Acidobacteriales bacterium]|nr:Gfo/Idh/MocA family oxidoreductase [Terriglobales bacterium]